MAERIFTAGDLAGTASVCGCLNCRLGDTFAGHLTTLRDSYPGTVTMLGHRTAAPGTTAVPHFVALLLTDAQPHDVVVWEEMRPDQLAAWLPPADARERVPQLAARVPLLIAVRQAIRTGALTPAGPAGAELAAGRYPSFRYLTEHWPALSKEFTP